MDVKSAFLHGDLSEEVYVSQPPGFVQTGADSKVLKLHKALYGLRQAPRAWNAKLDQSLISLGFDKCPREHAVYKRLVHDTLLLVGVYVDDLIIAGSCNLEVAKFKRQMKAMFEMSDLGLLSYYLGIEVQQSPSSITLSQAGYAIKILKKSGMADSNPSHTPMEERIKVSKESSFPLVPATEYRSIIGSLRYLVNTRPDIAFSVGVASRFMEKPTTEHQAIVKKILRYIRGTVGYGITYDRGKKDSRLIGYSDSDYAGDIDQRKSTSGMAFFLGSNLITWSSQKQRTVALSSCEAEYVSAAIAACQGVWLIAILDDIRMRSRCKVILRVDNMSAIALGKNPVFHERSKHIDTKYHFIRECIEMGTIEMEHVSTQDQLADIFTKALGRVKFKEMRQRLGMREVKPPSRE